MNIGVFGDSWAFSSFKKLPEFREELDVVTFQKLFKATDIDVFNHAKQGGTNLDTVAILKKHKDYDLNIVFQTDPIRQCLDKNLNPLPDIDLPLSKNFEDLCEELLKNFYLELEDTGKNILLIGGCTKLCHKHVPPSIKTLPQSWTELVIPGFKDNYFYWIEPTLSLFYHARKKFNWHCDLSDFFEFEKQIANKNYLWQSSDDFSWCHAAESAYKKMFEKILEETNDLNS